MMKSTRAVASLLTLGTVAVGLLASKPAAAGSVRCLVKAPETTTVSTEQQNLRTIDYCGISGEYGFGQVTKTGASTYTLLVGKGSSGAGNVTALLVDGIFGNQAGNCTVVDGPGAPSSNTFACSTTVAASSLWFILVVN